MPLVPYPPTDTTPDTQTPTHPHQNPPHTHPHPPTPTHSSRELWVTVAVHGGDRLQADPVGPQQLPKGAERDVLPSLQHTRLEVAGFFGPSAVTIANGFDHPTPHDLNQVEIRRVGWPCRETV